MKITGAVLEEIGAARPYAESAPLRVQELELDPPGPEEVLDLYLSKEAIWCRTVHAIDATPAHNQRPIYSA